MQVTPKKIELPTREDKKKKSDIKRGIKTEKDKNQKKDDKKESNLLFKDYLKFFILIFLTFFTCLYLWVLFSYEKRYEKLSGIDLIVAALFLCLTVKAWYALLKKNIFKAFLEDFKGPEEPMDGLESEPREFTEKEKRQLRIFVNCTIAFISILLIIDDFISGIIISIFLIFTRKKITTGLEQILKEENNGKDS